MKDSNVKDNTARIQRKYLIKTYDTSIAPGSSNTYQQQRNNLFLNPQGNQTTKSGRSSFLRSEIQK